MMNALLVVAVLVFALIGCAALFQALPERVRTHIGGLFAVLFVFYVLAGIVIALFQTHLPREPDTAYTPREFVR